MLKRYRRSIAAVVAPIAFFILSGGDLLLAAGQAHSAAPAHGAVRPTADLFDRSGKLVRHVEGESFRPLALSTTVRQLRSDSTVLEQWRSSALEYGKRSKRGKASVAGVLQVIDALAAPNDAEYHARVRRLGVDVVTSAARNDLEQAGIQTSFSVHGVVKLLVFKGAVSAAADDASNMINPILNREDTEADHASGPSVALDELGTGAMQADCYVDGEPCATAQEREDAMIVAVGLDDEATAVENDTYAAVGDLGGDDNEDPPFTGGPSAEPSFMMICSNEFWNFVGAAASTHGAAITLIGVLLAPVEVPALVVAGGLVAIGGGLAWMYSAGGGLLDCKRAYVK